MMHTMAHRQLMPGLSKLAPFPPQSRLKYWLSVVLWRALWRLSSSLWLIDWFLFFKFLCDLQNPFNARITATRCSYGLIIVFWSTQRINPRANFLNTTEFSYIIWTNLTYWWPVTHTHTLSFWSLIWGRFEVPIPLSLFDKFKLFYSLLLTFELKVVHLIS